MNPKKEDYIQSVVRTSIGPGELFTAKMICEMATERNRAAFITTQTVALAIRKMDDVVVYDMVNGRARYKLKEVANAE